MKILISADIEGIGSVVRREHSGVQEREYLRARKFMTEEVNAAVRGAFDSGASEVLVVDAHNVGLNLFPEDLDERAGLIMGSPRPLAMMEGVDRGMDGVCFVGYHGMAGMADAAIAHIFHGRVSELKFNGLRVGEIGLNALIAGVYNVPVIMISGDQVACREASQLIPEIETAQVKESIGAYAGICSHPVKCRDKVYRAVQKAISRMDGISPLVLDPGEVTMEVRLTTASGIDRALRLPGTQRVSGDTLEYRAKDYFTAYQAFAAIADLVELVPFI
ncbi:M55 family metallopeptidase [Desulfospira joergensenii]|uniref:M55 family metallopeptidase n=1 Tax=Desulfospira joergensenii TaxID=53329 RepID=UPI0003B43F05|nr:M55 family metallopeptidase [Desulfospira joergensenii]